MSNWRLLLLLALVVCSCSPYYFSDRDKVWKERYAYYFAEVRPEWSERDKNLISEGRWRTGMTLEQVALATRSGCCGVQENLRALGPNYYHYCRGMTWDYSDSHGTSVYTYRDYPVMYRLRFRNGILESWSESPIEILY